MYHSNWRPLYSQRWCVPSRPECRGEHFCCDPGWVKGDNWSVSGAKAPDNYSNATTTVPQHKKAQHIFIILISTEEEDWSMKGIRTRSQHHAPTPDASHFASLLSRCTICFCSLKWFTILWRILSKATQGKLLSASVKGCRANYQLMPSSQGPCANAPMPFESKYRFVFILENWILLYQSDT